MSRRPSSRTPVLLCRRPRPVASVRCLSTLLTSSHVNSLESVSDVAILADFARLPGVFEQLQVLDPLRTYILETAPVPWSDASFRCFFCVLWWYASAWTRPTSAMLSVERDAIQLPSVLAFGMSLQESGEDCAWLVERFRGVFPSRRALMHDQGSALVGGDVAAVIGWHFVSRWRRVQSTCLSTW